MGERQQQGLEPPSDGKRSERQRLSGGYRFLLPGGGRRGEEGEQHQGRFSARPGFQTRSLVVLEWPGDPSRELPDRKSFANVVKSCCFLPPPLQRRGSSLPVGARGRVIGPGREVHALCGKPCDRSSIWVSELPVCQSERLPGRPRPPFAPLASHANLPVSPHPYQ